MLERIQERSVVHSLEEKTGMSLHGAQKALARWAIVDDYNNILDLHCQDAHLLRYFSQKFDLRACGITDDPERAKALRLSVPTAEIFCARITDIPWRSEAFDTVFYQIKKSEPMPDLSFLQEAARVLKPGGQLIIALQGLPEMLRRAASVVGMMDCDGCVTPHTLLQGLEKAGLSDVSYRLAQPFIGIIMGWKRA